MKLRYFLVVVEDIDLKIKRQKSRLLFFLRKMDYYSIQICHVFYNIWENIQLE